MILPHMQSSYSVYAYDDAATNTLVSVVHVKINVARFEMVVPWIDCRCQWHGWLCARLRAASADHNTARKENGSARERSRHSRDQITRYAPKQATRSRRIWGVLCRMVGGGNLLKVARGIFRTVLRC